MCYRYVLILLGCCLYCLWSQAQDNNLPLDLQDNGDYTSFSHLDDVIKDYNIFFVGENHNFKKSNVGLQLKMFKYLHQKGKVNTILIEAGRARGWLVNKYIQTGDKELKKALENYSYNYYQELYDGLREYNRKLPKEEKIEVVGIDVERSLSTSLKVLTLLMPETQAPQSIGVDIESMRGLVEAYDQQSVEEAKEKAEENNYHSFWSINPENSIEEIIKNFEKYTKDYQTYLGEEFPLFEKILLETKDGQQWYKYRDEGMIQADYFREGYMYQRFLEIAETHPDSKFFGQFGRCHTTLDVVGKNWCDWYNFNALASRINDSEEERFKDKVFSIGVFYNNQPITYSELSFDDNISELIKDIKASQGLFLMDIQKNPKVPADLQRLFQYLIINYNNVEDERDVKEIIPPTYDGVSLGNSGPQTLVGFSKGVFWGNFDELNDLFLERGIDKVNLPISTTGGALTFFDNRGPDVSFLFHRIDPQQRETSDTTFVKLSGMLLGLEIGSDFTKNRKLDIIPAIGAYYNMLRLELNGLLDNYEDNLFEDPAALTYANHSLMGNVSLKTRINIAFLSLSFKGGYLFDFSDGKWRANGEKILSSPKTKMSGPFASVDLSLNLSKW